MFNHEWRPISESGFSKYFVSDIGVVKRVAYTEYTGRYLKEHVVSCRSIVGGSVQVRLLSDDKVEHFLSLRRIIHEAFPEFSDSKCKQLAQDRYNEANSNAVEPLDYPGEMWKDCAGYEDRYEASTFGRIRRKPRILTRSNGRRYTVTAIVMKQSCIGRDYRCINIPNKEGGKFEFVHRLIALTFIPNPDNLPEVNHIDGCGSNNHADNLEWSSHADNALHAYQNGLCDTPHEIICIDTQEVFNSIYELADILSISWSSIQNRISSNSPIDGKYYQYVEKLNRFT